MKFKQLIIGLYCLTLVTNVHSEEANVSPELHDLLQEIEASRQRLDIPAIAITLVDKDKTIWSGTFGITDRNTGKKADNDTVFRIGSITKTFTALATLILVDDGKLNLDERLIDIAPDLKIKNEWHDTHPVKVSHLLEHTAGLTDLTKEEFDFNEPLSLEDALKSNIDSRVIRWPPGMHYSYTNVGAGLLAYIIEKRSGKTYEEFVHDRIFKPLGMSSASFFPDKVTMKQLATGYDSDGVSPIPYWHMTFRAFGAINIKPVDMSPFLQLMLNKGTYQKSTILPVALFDKMQTPSTTLAAKSGLTFGYGSGVYSFFHKGHIFYGHGGDGDGYLARYGYNPESGMAYFVVINVFRDRDLIKIRNHIEDYIIKDLPPAEYQSTKVPVDQLQQYTGNYVSSTWRFPVTEDSLKSTTKIKIVIKNDKLNMKHGKKTRQLIPVTSQHFRLKDESQATMAFIRDKEGRLFLQSESGNFLKVN